MTSDYIQGLDSNRQRAVRELSQLIVHSYPSATLYVEPSTDDPQATYITAVVDIDDPDEVMDLAIDRLIALQVTEGIPVSVIPIRTPERTAQLVDGPSVTIAGEALLRQAQA
jgi:hypothetical protein